MGKIRQLREDQLINGGSQEHIYPITHAKAVYSKDRQSLQDIIDSIREGNFLKDGSIKTKHLANESVTTDKIRDDCVNGRKIQKGTIELYHLSAMLASILKAAIGLPEDLINQMTYLYEKINEIQPISEDDIDKITEGSYVPEDEETPPPLASLNEKVEVLEKKVKTIENDNSHTRMKLDSFIDSDLTTEQVNDLLDKQ